MILRIFDAFFLQNCICWILFGTLTIIFDVLDEIIGKIIESRYIGICPIIDKIIDIGRRLPQIIGDFRELSAKLLISRMTEELSKIYSYRKKWLTVHPYWCKKCHWPMYLPFNLLTCAIVTAASVNAQNACNCLSLALSAMATQPLCPSEIWVAMSGHWEKRWRLQQNAGITSRDEETKPII